MKGTYQKPTEWKEYRANGIATNPLEYWYSVVRVGGHYRVYKIIPQFPSPTGDGNTVDMSLDPELYILTERIDFKDIESVEDKDSLHLDDSKYHIVRVFKTMDEAKGRAIHQVAHIEQLVLAYFGPEEKEEEEK